MDSWRSEDTEYGGQIEKTREEVELKHSLSHLTGEIGED